MTTVVICFAPTPQQPSTVSLKDVDFGYGFQRRQQVMVH